jgi:putative aldouronate transport system substrate-binding protein
MKEDFMKKTNTVLKKLAALLFAAAMGGTLAAQTQITIVSTMYQSKLPDSNNEIFKRIEAATNTKLKIDYVPKPNYLDKLNVLIAGNKLPMVTVTEASHIKSSAIVNLAKAGGFWEVDPTFAKYPNLKAFYAQYPLAIKNTLINGKLYGLPRPRPLGRTGIVYRADWFAALGVNPPTTPEEFYAVAKLAVAKNAGQGATIGFLYADTSLGSPGWNGIENLCVAFGGPNVWGDVNGTLVPDVMTDEYMQALTLLRKMYQEKLINTDFPLASGSKRYDAFNRGQAGMYNGTLNDIYAYHNDLFTIQPQAKLAIAPPMGGPKGIRVPSTPGHNGMFMFSKKAVKSAGDLDKILKFYDKLLDPKMLDLLRYGIENVHYTVVNGKKVVTPEQRRKLADDLGDFVWIYLEHAIVNHDDDSELQKTCNAALAEYTKYAVPNPVDGYVSPTYAQLGGQLDKLQQDARIRYVMGDLDEKGYKAQIQEWWNRGGEKIAAEYNALYKTEKKK